MRASARFALANFLEALNANGQAQGVKAEARGAEEEVEAEAEGQGAGQGLGALGLLVSPEQAQELRMVAEVGSELRLGSVRDGGVPQRQVKRAL